MGYTNEKHEQDHLAERVADILIQKLRQELQDYDKGLIDKPEIIVLTKKDEADKSTTQEVRDRFSAQTDAPIYATSILDEDSIKNLRDRLVKHLRQKIKKES